MFYQNSRTIFYDQCYVTNILLFKSVMYRLIKMYTFILYCHVKKLYILPYFAFKLLNTLQYLAYVENSKDKTLWLVKQG